MSAASSLTDAQVLSGKDDAEMMKRDHLWPHVMLPLKRIKDGMLETAVLCNPGPPWQIVENATIFGASGQTKVTHFKSAEEIVAAGWRVD
jgi:hypothetical protein